MRSRVSFRILLCAGCFAALLLALRLYTLLGAVGPDGLLPRGSWALPVTTVLCAACFLTLWAMALRLRRKPGSNACFPAVGPWAFCRLLSGLLLTMGSLFSLLAEALEPLLLACHILGLVCGLGLVLLTLARGGGRAGFWVQALVTLYLLFGLVLRFRDWSHEPLVIELIPRLLALLCGMVSVMLISGFALGVGHRRSTVLFGLCAGIFTLMALPDFFLRGVAAGEVLFYLGLGLWCATHAVQLLLHRPRRKGAGQTAAAEEKPEKRITSSAPELKNAPDRTEAELKNAPDRTEAERLFAAALARTEEPLAHEAEEAAAAETAAWAEEASAAGAALPIAEENAAALAESAPRRAENSD